jgi:membrane fusion protein (multidrug efflux system)
VDASVSRRRDSDPADVRPGRRIALRRILKWAAIAIVLIVGGIVGWHYWQHAQLYVSTDDAYVNADTVQIAAQVPGPIAHLNVRDQQHVRAGDLLFDIDPQPFRLAVEQAQAQLALAEQSVSQQSAAVAAARAQLAQRQAEYRKALSDDQRVRHLIKDGFLSAQSAEATHTQAETAAAAVKAAEANLQEALSALGASGDRNANVQAAKARLDQAQLDLQRTRVTAPTSGTIANLSLRPGNPVQALVPVFSLVSDRDYWVDANFKETQLHRVRPGQRAKVTTDVYRDHPFQGEVQSLSGGAGTAFSLLPPENATGNWVKVTQRVPVRVRILDPDPEYPLPIGTTASVEVRAR